MVERKEDTVDRAIRSYSISVIGYDPVSPVSGQPMPREILEWARRKQQREESAQKVRGALLLAAMTTAATLIVTSMWGQIVRILGLH